MPIYEFRCYDCGRIFEKLIFSKTEEQEVKCPFCGSEKVEKVVSNVCAMMKGVGDYKKSSCGGGFGFS
ncbi:MULTISPECIES: zinc ribbon domain-containing protein [Thermodesulfobacterium]|jgi:putative FmdB family regulatory protein|uniref:Zinc ribbon domain-containing protein n=2 Tax=Thermodesulfobacterium commune TaxID=1741 RepID=A0A101FJR7_9BACT|nr:MULTISPECIES: zinc ribbon domain-containing protein [Thermodesulfobacterium]KUJ98313.1 MAG: Regulatory protein, FmdB family [Thermodesulfobacterium sp. 37_54]KUK19904.1 MAG: Regulatory protein, FmdB family [Thermodesulfobacterium commune]AIH03923.1 hypothetical protein HL41_03535 [Thermodesulfobacterium commune DSM 2178]KUK38313.1 MAG: Regulatory protein, FmdB family [Thermodesulfobacterium commune]MBZ4681800.1 hypothetical protein [Thermodesulfobacterium sp.]